MTEPTKPTKPKPSLAAMTRDDWRYIGVFFLLCIIVGIVFAAVAAALRFLL